MSLSEIRRCEKPFSLEFFDFNLVKSSDILSRIVDFIFNCFFNSLAFSFLVYLKIYYIILLIST